MRAVELIHNGRGAHLFAASMAVRLRTICSAGVLVGFLYEAVARF